MLELLTQYAVQHDLVAEPGFAPKAACWGIQCDSKHPIIIDLKETSGNKKGLAFDCCPDLSQPELKRGGAGCRHFLLDTVDVVALLTDPLNEKLLAKHRYFVDLLRKASEAMPELAQVADCLENEASLKAIRRELLEKKAKANDNATFAIAGQYLVDSSSWHGWWRDFRKTLTPQAKGKKEATPRMRCFVTGEMVTPVLTHPKVSGLVDVGGQSAGDVLASFKQSSFRSFGLVQSTNAAVSEEAAALYRAALNDLLAKHSHRLAAVKVVHWFKESVPDHENLFSLIVGSDLRERFAQELAQDLLKSFETGERAPHLHGNRYYAMTLSGAAGRIMLHDWMEGEFESLVRAVVSWFDALDIIRRDGSGLAPCPKFMAVMAALVRELKDLPAPMVTTMWRVALDGNRQIPDSILAQALARMRIDIIQDNPIKHACAGLIKAYHMRQGDQDMKPGLNEEHSHPAYQCGRLMAVFDYLQYKSLGDVNSSVVQRYYAAAAATPALVLGRLMRNAQFHLNKLSEKKGRGFFQKQLIEIMGRISEFPETLDLREQSLFALGYYHQKAHRPTPKPVEAQEDGETEGTSDADN